MSSVHRPKPRASFPSGSSASWPPREGGDKSFVLILQAYNDDGTVRACGSQRRARKRGMRLIPLASTGYVLTTGGKPSASASAPSRLSPSFHLPGGRQA